MKISVKIEAKYEQPSPIVIKLSQRLPPHVLAASDVTCSYSIESKDRYYLLEIHAQGNVDILCQRCLQSFSYGYNTTHAFAVCESDDYAHDLMNQYDPIVTANFQVDLVDVLTDNLYLFIPEKHTDITDCGSDVTSLIGQKY
ncbi:MAG: YceD family protein [Legionella sp.]